MAAPLLQPTAAAADAVPVPADGDPAVAAQRLSAQALLNCYVRERRSWNRVGADLRLPLHRRPGVEIVVPVTHWSPTHRHQFALPARLRVRGDDAGAVDLPLLATLLLDDLADDGSGPDAPSRPPADVLVLLRRIADSAANMESDLRARQADVPRGWGAGPRPFIETEQALLVGHMVHPTPKSRGEMAGDDRARFAPERQSWFGLHWYRVDRRVLHERSALDTPASKLVLGQLATDPTVSAAAVAEALDDPARFALLPAHPWEAAHLRADPAVADLLDTGLLTDVGPLGARFTPTTSVRTVYAPQWAWMLKFSLHVRVTNSMRVTLPKELDRAVEAAQLRRGPWGALMREVAPTIVVVEDPAYLSVRHEGATVDGLSVLLRENRWPASAAIDATSLTALCQDHPFGGRSRLGAIVAAIAQRSGRTSAEVGREWFRRFCATVVAPLVRLYGDAGICFEPHQQNTLVELAGGWPVRGVCRDSQGYFHREAAHGDLTAVMPGLGEASESIFPEALADERLTYYLFVNMTLGVVNALGTAGCADEEVLLADLRLVLEDLRSQGARYPLTLLDVVLDRDELPCKANLRTRVHDLDELVGDIATQSVYVTVPNPLATVRRSTTAAVR